MVAGVTPSVAEIETVQSVGFILAEEAALKRHLSGLSMPRPRSLPNTEVPVWYRWPDGERAQQYPFITLDLLDITPDIERQTSVWDLGTDPSVFEGTLYDTDVAPGQQPVVVGAGQRVGQYFPSVSSDSMPEIGAENPTTGYRVENYKPVKLIYQVTTHATSAQDDRWMMAKFFIDVFPPNPVWLSVDADKTWRRMERLSFTNADTQETTETDKRHFRKIYTISIEAEVPVDTTVEVVRASRVHVDLYDRASDTREAVDHVSSSEHHIAIGEFTEPQPAP